MLKKLIWSLRFWAEIRRISGLRGKKLAEAYEAEIRTWTDSDEWKDWEPEEAASESLSYWAE